MYNITGENYEAYKNLLSIKEDSKYSKVADLFQKIMHSISIIISALILMKLPFTLYGHGYGVIVNALITGILLLTEAIFMVLITDKIAYKINISKFQKDYPNIDIDIDKYDLMKSLKKYKKLSKVPKDIEIQKEEHLSKLNDEIKEMTTKEKIKYLKKERKFWKKVAIKEKYEDELFNSIQKVKK